MSTSIVFLGIITPASPLLELVQHYLDEQRDPPEGFRALRLGLRVGRVHALLRHRRAEALIEVLLRLRRLLVIR